MSRITTPRGGQLGETPRGLDAPDPASQVLEGGSSIRMPKIFLTPKRLLVSVNKRTIKQNQTERAEDFRTISIVGPSRDKGWTALTMIQREEQGNTKESKLQRMRVMEIGLVRNRERNLRMSCREASDFTLGLGWCRFFIRRFCLSMYGQRLVCSCHNLGCLF